MVRIEPDYEALSRAAASLIAEAAAEAVRERGRFAIALAGGSTPRGAYESLATPPLAESVPWSRTHVFWGDERCVPPDDARSNYRLAWESLLSRVPVPAENVHRIQVERGAEAAALDYERQLRAYADADSSDRPAKQTLRAHERQGDRPSHLFDVAVLGMGSDGHTASLFPGSAALHEARRWVAPVRKPGDALERVTLTYPALNLARRVMFIVAGADKTATLAEILGPRRDLSRLPAQGIAPNDGELLWLVDAAAAKMLVR